MWVNVKNVSIIEHDRRKDTKIAYFGGYFEDSMVELPVNADIPDEFYMIEDGDVRYFINPHRLAFVDHHEEMVVIAPEGFYWDEEEEEIAGVLLFPRAESPDAYRQALRLYEGLRRGDFKF